MPCRSVCLTPTGNCNPALFSLLMDNSGAVNLGCRAHSPSSCKSSPSDKSSCRRLDLDPSGSPNQSNDGSGARMPRTGGGDRHPNIQGQPVEDSPNNDYNLDECLDSLKASDKPMLQKFAAYLSAKDKTISTLEQHVKFERDKCRMQEAIRGYDGTGSSSFCFHPDDIGNLLHTFIIPHIHDLDDQRYYFDLNMATAKPKDLSCGISMVTNLSKNVKN